MTTFGYARVSTDGQTLDAQLEALKAADCEKLFREKVSGARADRAQLTQLLREIGSGDVLIVSRLDRLARSTRDLLNILDALSVRGASFRSLGDQWADTTTPNGRLMLTVLGGLAEFERELIRARRGEGRARAEARGVHMGRPPKLTAHQWREAQADLASGAATQADLARRFNVSESTISRRAARFNPALVAVRPPLDADTQRATRAFMQKIKGRFPLHEAFLFGSRARGTHNADSDADVAVILKGEKGSRSEISREMSDAAYDVMLETGVLIGPLPFWKEEFKWPNTFSNPELIRNIKREGFRL